MITATEKRKGGRPAIGHDPIVHLRLPVEKRAEIMAWAEENHAESLSSAIRRLIDQSLAAGSPKSKRRPKA
jgi:hypothetical protein